MRVLNQSSSETRTAVDVLCEACKSFEAEVKDRDIIRDAQVQVPEQNESNPVQKLSPLIASGHGHRDTRATIRRSKAYTETLPYPRE